MKTFTRTLLMLLVAAAAWAQSKGPATVKLTAEGVTALFTFEDRSTLKVTTKGSPLRAGTYWTKSLAIYMKDKKGRVWEMRGTKRFGSVRVVMVNPGQEKILYMGPPIGMVLAATQGRPPDTQTVKLTLAAVGLSSEGYYPGAYLNGKKPPPPAFKITDDAGKTLATGRFGIKDNRCSFDWHVPAGFKGSFNVEIAAVMGPYPWKLFKSAPFVVE